MNNTLDRNPAYDGCCYYTPILAELSTQDAMSHTNKQQQHPEPSNKLIWSNQHGAWWRSNRFGYTTDIYEAGHYTPSEAEEIVLGAKDGGPVGGFNGQGGLEPEVAVDSPLLVMYTYPAHRA